MNIAIVQEMNARYCEASEVQEREEEKRETKETQTDDYFSLMP